MKRVLILLAQILVVAGLALLSRCQKQRPESPDHKGVYLNHADSVAYVGMETCRSCHGDVHATFQNTGMGRSFGPATPQKSKAELKDSSRLYDPDLDLYYHPYWQDDRLFLEEFRLRGKDTVHRLKMPIDYVIGSGQHTNSHLIQRGGYLFQAPFTWYAQKGHLDLPPGFENGANSRFSRPIGLECMSCHNAMPTGFVAGSTNKFNRIDQGINCERCHGPGEVHVKKILAGDITDTAVAIDYSIVNPRKLPVQLQFEICQRCHLQGNAVLKPGKSFFDFKPGMQLSEVMEVYLPRYEGQEDRFIMASHVDRFKMSKCFEAGQGHFNCTSCHNPHLSVQKTAQNQFNRSCQNCHRPQKVGLCSAPEAELAARDNDCVACHMPSSGSSDIPHVTVHDHYLRKPTKTKAQSLAESRFLGLQAVNQPQPDNRSKALAYLQHAERFRSQAYHLDSARRFLNRLAINHPEKLILEVYYHYLKKDYASLVNWVEAQGGAETLAQLKQSSWDNAQAWTCYRIGEAYKAMGKPAIARLFYEQATELAPYELDFRNKLASVFLQSGKVNEARRHYHYVLKEYPEHREALNNLGYLALQARDLKQAEKYLQKALHYYPDYEMAWLNWARLQALREDAAALQNALNEVLRINPENQAARNMLNQFASR